MKPIQKSDFIGKYIKSVYECLSPRQEGEAFEYFIIYVELDSGLIISLQQDPPILKPEAGHGVIFASEKRSGAKNEIVHDVVDKMELKSRILSVFIPYSWPDEFGIFLENGYALHNGHGDSQNAVLFYSPDAYTKQSLIEFQLPG